MPRPANTPRLNAIDAAELGAEAQVRAAEYLHSLAMRIGVELQIDARAPQLEHAVRTLCGYAQGHHVLDAPVSEYLQSICEALWIRPIDGDGYSTPELDQAISGDLDELDDDLAGRLCVVMVAALGREALELGNNLTVAQLAALLSCSPDHARLRAREGQIKLVEGERGLEATAKEARRLLRERQS